MPHWKQNQIGTVLVQYCCCHCCCCHCCCYTDTLPRVAKVKFNATNITKASSQQRQVMTTVKAGITPVGEPSNIWRVLCRLKDRDRMQEQHISHYYQTHLDARVTTKRSAMCCMSKGGTSVIYFKLFRDQH